MKIIIDFETRSEVDLKKVGAYEYAVHPTTDILVCSYKLHGAGAIKSWSPLIPIQESAANFVLLKRLAESESTTFVAHNAYFEMVIMAHVLPRYGITVPFNPDRFECTAAMASSLALPRSLEGVCEALKLPVQKDMEGRRIMLKYSKPRKATKNNSEKWFADKDEQEKLVEYCETDVLAEELVFDALKDIAPVCTPKEKRLWNLTQKLNYRGIKIDRELVKTVIGLSEKEREYIREKFEGITGIESPTQRDKLVEFVRNAGEVLPDAKKLTIVEALKNEKMNKDVREVLGLRLEASKTSIAKFQAFLQRSVSDGFVRDHLVYHAASTGRFGGSGVQLQNLPRPKSKDVASLCEDILKNDIAWLKCLHGPPMELFSDVLRPTLISENNRELVGGDYNAIEVRVLFWLARCSAGLNAFRDKRDLYKEMAGIIFRKDPKLVTKEERFLGKTVVLGAGYGMGHATFKRNLEIGGNTITETLAKTAINAYRTTYREVPTLWRAVESAAIMAVTKKITTEAGRCKFFVKGNFLFIELPCGRRLAYANPVVRRVPSRFDEGTVPQLHHHGVNSLTKKWESAPTYGGRLTENISQAVARSLMTDAMLRIDGLEHCDLLLTVHDELLASQVPGIGHEWFEKAMCESSEWSKDIPVAVEGWTGKRYAKA